MEPTISQEHRHKLFETLVQLMSPEASSIDTFLIFLLGETSYYNDSSSKDDIRFPSRYMFYLTALFTSPSEFVNIYNFIKKVKESAQDREIKDFRNTDQENLIKLIPSTQLQIRKEEIPLLLNQGIEIPLELTPEKVMTDLEMLFKILDTDRDYVRSIYTNLPTPNSIIGTEHSSASDALKFQQIVHTQMRNILEANRSV